MLRDPGRALQTYVERLPDVLRADWALGLMPVGPDEVVVVARSKNAPRDAHPAVPDGGYGGGDAVMVRDATGASTVTAFCEIRAGGPVVAIVREGGPSYRTPELGHLKQLCDVAALLSGAPSPPDTPSQTP